MRHSQSLSKPPLKAWLLAKKEGEIVVGHCTCMAGLGETCSHIAATVFLLEHSAKQINEMVGTDQLCAWLPTTIGKTVPKKTVADMDFASSTERLAKLSGSNPQGRCNLLLILCISLYIHFEFMQLRLFFTS